ncbi:hypothetical protein [Streptomyces exfoliatus]|uniref:hypothetical protein n=1 Tax=Streptomyces exfoliatus TaxID=1905 RepID=UPI003C2EA5F9
MPTGDETQTPTTLSRRRRWVGGLAVGAVLLTTGGITAAQLIKSPAQAAAESSPPPPSVLTAEVEYRVLTDAVILRGSVTAKQRFEVVPGASDAEASAAVVTKLPLTVGAEVREGHVLAEVSGRPIVALAGGLPLYRDLKPGTKGDDVAQFQKALARVGHSTAGDSEGVFGAKTKAALVALYEGIGYDPRSAHPDEASLLEGAEEEVMSARRALEDVREAADPKTSGSHDRQVQRAQEDLTKALGRLSEVEAKTGPMLPVSEVVFLPQYPGRIDTVTSRLGAKVSGSILTVSSGELEIHGYLQHYQKGLVRPKQQVDILSEGTGQAVAGTVVSVADTMSRPQSTDTADPDAKAGDGGTPDTSAQGYQIVVKPTSRLKGGAVGQDVRLTVEAAAAKAKALIVPVSAISAGADGRTAVTVTTGHGEQRRVLVTTGSTGDGYVEVRPSPGERLSAGDRVVVGVRNEALLKDDR